MLIFYTDRWWGTKCFEFLRYSNSVLSADLMICSTWWNAHCNHKRRLSWFGVANLRFETWLMTCENLCREYCVSIRAVHGVSLKSPVLEPAVCVQGRSVERQQPEVRGWVPGRCARPPPCLGSGWGPRRMVRGTSLAHNIICFHTLPLWAISLIRPLLYVFFFPTELYFAESKHQVSTFLNY